MFNSRINEIEDLKLKIEKARGAADTKTIWLPKVFCIFSPYLFYDKYVEIVRKLVDKLQSAEGSVEGLPNLFEALVFEIVCKIETPVRKPVLFDGTI